MKPGDTVITPKGEEGKVIKITGYFLSKNKLVYVSGFGPYLESELKVKEEKK